MMANQNDRDPIREAPLREPGESLREQLIDDALDRVFMWLMLTVIAATVAVFEWLRWLLKTPVSPIQMTVVAIATGCVCAWRFYSNRQHLQQLRQGIKGERAVGQYLQSALLPLGYYVLHDVCFDTYNVDHVVIGPGGVFAVEVKARTKPARGGGKIVYDGKQVLVNGFEQDRDPIAQAAAGASSIQRTLEQFTGKKVSVRASVLFPGWWIDPQPKGVDVWVLSPKGFVSFVENEKPRLSPQDSRVLMEGLARYVRTRLGA